jgi:deoxyribonuclease IV
MFGSHLSIAGGLHNALLAAEKYAMETVQVFTKFRPLGRMLPCSLL